MAGRVTSDQVTIEKFNELYGERVSTLNTEGRTLEMGCFEALKNAAAATNALQGRMNKALSEADEMQKGALELTISGLQGELSVLETLAVKTANLAAFFKESVSHFALSESYKQAFPVNAEHFDRTKGWYSDKCKELDGLQKTFSSYLYDKGVSTTYLQDSWSQLQAKLESK